MRCADYERLDPPEPMTREQIERRRLKMFCDDCMERRPCTCDREAEKHVAEQMEEEAIREGL